MLCLPQGILSKGLTMLECILCAYTPANMQHFSSKFAQHGDDPAAAGRQQQHQQQQEGRQLWFTGEKPLFEVLFIVDVLFLGGIMLGHCEFECRYFFLKSRYSQIPPHPIEVTANAPRREMTLGSPRVKGIRFRA